MLETHGIMGFILWLRRHHYAKDDAARTGEVLRVLQEASDAKTIPEFFRGFYSLYEPEILRCPVHGSINAEREGDAIPPSSKGKQTKEKVVREMRVEVNTPCPSPRPQPGQQCTCEFDDIVWELSSEMALVSWAGHAEASEEILFNLWKRSGGSLFLHEPLSALQEVWRSVTDQEIGTFRRHFDKRNLDRVARLKALGNAIVPQVAYAIIRGIAKIERGLA